MYFGESQDTFWICLCHHDSIHLHFATMPSHGWPLLLSSLTNSLDVLPSQPESLMPSDGMFPSLELCMHNCTHNSTPICPEQITANYYALRRHVTSLSNYTMHNCVCNSAPCAPQPHSTGTCPRQLYAKRAFSSFILNDIMYTVHVILLRVCHSHTLLSPAHDSCVSSEHFLLRPSH